MAADPRGIRGGPLIARLGLAVGAVLLVLVVAELGARALWSAPWYERIVEEQASQELAFHEVGGTRFPLRTAPPQARSSGDGTRILFLGDSFTYGLGVAGSDTFVSRLEQRLGATGPLEVWNGGVPGSLTNVWWEVYQEVAPALEPDLVVAVFFLRDGVRGVTSRGQIAEIRERMRGLGETSALYRTSRLYRLARDRMEMHRLSDLYLKRLEVGYLGTPSQTAEWRRAQTTLVRIRNASERSGARFALVVFPMLFGLEGDYPLEAVCDTIEAFARRNHIPVLSLLPAFRHRHAPDLWVSPLDQHPNEEAHRIAAEAMAPFLEGLLRSQDRSPGAGGPPDGPG